ncbi:HNH endonuclease [Flavobacterium sp.]|uniref:HNH endonuclease n=1 Tax=Flavobacterium sp. TaxID=239 RepID=UPI0037522612
MSAPQNYEDYWSLTNAFTDYNGDKFLSTLKICVDFIDEYKNEEYSPEKYTRLQLRIQHALGIELISIRKAINQLVKMGFINSFLLSYNSDTLEYLSAKTNKKRESLLSKIVYSYSSFNRSINNESNLHQMNFLIKTLIENGKLSRSEIIALMLVDIEKVEKGYLDKDELKRYDFMANKIGFVERKYNQVAYLYNSLNKLDDIVFVREELYFEEDAKRIFGDELKEERKARDPYLHRLYKNQLQEESIYHFEDTKCMVEKLAYPVLIASHIKPFFRCDENEAYDANNGILLSKNIDSLFDLGYITFSDTGKIIFSSQLKQEVKDFIENYSLDNRFINAKRLEYLEYHRNEIFEKRYKYA